MQINNVNIYGLEESIIASGYPMLSEAYDSNKYEYHIQLENVKKELAAYYFGKEYKESSHLKRAFNLAKAKSGSGHDCYMKGILVQFDCHAPQYFWQQLQRYHFIDIVSSMGVR